MQKTKQISLILWVFVVAIWVAPIQTLAQKEPSLGKIYADAKTRQGKRPVIIIPGILGSELVNKDTGEVVWFDLSRSKDDDARLPIAASLKESKDKLVPRDIIRKIEVTKFLPEIQVYQQLIDTLKNHGGYTENSWDSPSDKVEDTFFVFPYDWRRDNVESAQLLIQKIDDLKKKLKRPELKFNILAHSMGGLIARYAAMYGDQDLPAGNATPQPNWAGEKHFNKIFLFGVPNEGSISALRRLLRGFATLGGSGTNLPFVRNLSPTDLATMPALFQLMPHAQLAKFYDEDLKPMKIDIYSVETWKKYEWSVFGDENFKKANSEAEVARFADYLTLMLRRAKKFHEALDVRNFRRSSLGFFLIGSDCKDTLDGAVIYKDAKKDKWVTQTHTDSFKNSKGEKVESSQLKDLLLMPGDGSVTRRSQLAETLAEDKRQSALFDSALPLTSALFICEDHEKITGNATVQNNFLTALVSEASR